MKYTYMLQLSPMLIFWVMLAIALYASNGSASRAAIARYTESSFFTVMLVVDALLVPVTQYLFGPSFQALAVMASGIIAAPSLSGVFAVFTLATLVLSMGLLAFVGGMTLRKLIADFLGSVVAPEPEQQVSTAAE